MSEDTGDVRTLDPDKPDSRRARLTGETAAQVNTAVTNGDQARRVLARVFSRAGEAALRGDLCPAEALRDFLRTYVPALCDHRFGRQDWTAMNLSLYEMRLLRATQTLCSGGNDEV